MPLSGCSSPANPCSADDACTPVGHTTAGGPDTFAANKTVSSPDGSLKAPAVGLPEKG